MIHGVGNSKHNREVHCVHRSTKLLDRVKLVAAALFAATLLSCARDPGACSKGSVYGVVVEVVDEATRHNAVPGSTMIVRDGEFTDSASARPQPRDSTPVTGLYLLGARDRPGTYTVLVRKPGYKEWRREDVTVTMASDSCHVNPVRLRAALTQFR